jgi:hypothetical protein
MPDTSSPYKKESSFNSKIFAVVLTVLQLITVSLAGFIFNSSVEHGKALERMQSYVENTKALDSTRDVQIAQIMRDLTDLRTRVAVVEYEIMSHREKPVPPLSRP